MSWVIDSAFSIHHATASLMYDKFLYVGNEDFDIRVWNTDQSKLYRKLPPDRSKQAGHTSRITGFAYSARYDLLFSCSFDGCIITWHGTTMVHKYRFSKKKKQMFPVPIYSIYYSEENEVLVIGMNSDIATFTLSPTIMSQLVANGDTCPFDLRQVVRVHNDIVHSITGHQKKLFSASYDRSVVSCQLLDLKVGKQVVKLPTTPSVIMADVATQGVIVGDLAGDVKLYTAEGLFLGALAEKLNQGIQCLYMDWAMGIIWIASKDGNIHLIDSKSPGQDIANNFQMFEDLPIAGNLKPSFEIILGNGLQTRISAIVSHKYVYSWKWSNYVYLFRLSSKKKKMANFTTFFFDDSLTEPMKTISNRRKKSNSGPLVEGKKVDNSLISPGLNVFYGGDSILALRPVSKFQYQSGNFLDKQDSTCMDFSYDELCLLIGFKNGNILSTCLSSIRNFTDMHSEGVAVTNIFVYASCCVSVSGEEKSIILWDIHDKLEMIQRRERAHEIYISASCAFKLSRELYTCDDKGYVRAWNVEPNHFRENMLIDHSQYGAITYCCPSRSEDILLCSSADGFVRGWPRSNLQGPPVFEFSVSPCYVTCLCGSFDNNVLIATDDKTIRVISLQTREEEAMYTGHTELITSIIVTNNSNRWVSIQWDGEIFFWNQLNSTSDEVSYKSPKDSYLSSGTTSRLPRLSVSRSDEKKQNQFMFSSSDDKALDRISNQHKFLLNQRREQERRTPQYRKIIAISDAVQKTMDKLKEEKP